MPVPFVALTHTTSVGSSMQAGRSSCLRFSRCDGFTLSCLVAITV